MLRSNFRRLIQTTAGYSLNTLVGPLFTLLLTPIYTRVLGVANYGIVETLIPLGMIMYMLGLLSLPSALPVLYYTPELADRQPRVVASALWVAALWSAALAAVGYLCAGPLMRVTLGDLARDDLADLVRLMMFGLPFGVLYGVQTTVLRLRFAVWRSNLLALLFMFVNAGANLLLVVALRWGVWGVVGAGVATNVVMGLAGLVVGTASLAAWPEPALMRRLLRTGFPLLPASLALWLLVYEDRLFLTRNVAFEQIGIYGIANKLASALALLVEPFKSAWGPLALSIQQEDNAPRTYAKVLTYYCVVGLGLALALSLFAHEALLIVSTPAFVGAEAYIWLLVLVPLASGFSLIVSIGLLIEKKLGQAAWVTVVAALVNTLLNIVLIAMLGLGVRGASIATAVGYGASALLAAARAQRVRSFPYEWRKIALVFGVYLALAGAGLALGSQARPLSIALRGLLLLAYPLALWLLGAFEWWELRLARRAITEPRQFLAWVMGRA
jgi:O-antigen/teichoic acid export membrane protein